MNIVGISACPAGIAHTYMCREVLIQAAQQRGHSCKIETQGTIGVEFELTPDDIKNADVVVLAADVRVSGEERFRPELNWRHMDFQSIALPTELQNHWLRGKDLNQRPPGYGPDELPGCSTSRCCFSILSY